MSSPEIVVYSKPGCCLCEQVKGQLKKLQELHEFSWREVNILEDSSAYEKFWDQIPVIFINGKKAFKYRLDEDRFVRILQSAGHKQREKAAPPH